MKAIFPIPALLVVALALWLPGCAVGPDYQRPAVETPAAYRSVGGTDNPSTGTNSVGDLGWWQVFQDPALTGYLGEALTNNWDIKIAAARVLQAEAALKVARSQFFPTVGAGGDLVTSRASERGPIPIPDGVNPQRGYGDVFAGMSSYEVDLWGKIRRASEAARARYLETQDAQRSVRQPLVAQGSARYIDIRCVHAEVRSPRVV